MTRAAVKPEIIQWARQRAFIEPEDLLARFPKYMEWEAGDTQPTLKQLEKFAKAVYVPVGYLFMDRPPQEELPIPDFRTLDNKKIHAPSPNLLDVVYNCQERQAWFKEFAQITRQPKLPFIGKANLSMNPAQVAQDIRDTIGFTLEARAACKTWEDARRLFIQKADEAGILVMVSGVVLSNNNRKLNTEEFRGFALSDAQAPLIFINGSDSKSGQMFTLAHEIAHLWLNSTGVSNAGAAPLSGFSKEEVWCNAVAAELLVPLEALKNEIREDEQLDKMIVRLIKVFKVSKLVMLRRLLDAKFLNKEEFGRAWAYERARLKEIAEKGGGGGDFYRTTVSRVSKRFTQALITSTLEGQTLYRDAFRMLGVSKTSTFNNLGREVGVML